MEKNSWYDIFLESIYEQFPKKAQVTRGLIDLLHLEREAVYRRFRKDVVFHAHEIVKMAAAWNISLDEMIGINSGKISFQMLPINYLNPSKLEFNNIQKKIKDLDDIELDTDSEYMEVRNRLPRPLSIGFLNIYRFKILNWVYQYNQNEFHKTLSNIIIPEKMYHEFEIYQKKMATVKNSFYILDQNIFEDFVTNIKYFHSILLVTDEEKELLKNELHALLDYMLDIANTGCYPKTQNKVNLYISKINIDTNYSYYYSNRVKTCLVHAFGKHDILSFNTEMVNNFRTWMHLKKRSSVQISEVNVKMRIDYFTEQRKIVDSL